MGATAAVRLAAGSAAAAGVSHAASRGRPRYGGVLPDAHGHYGHVRSAGGLWGWDADIRVVLSGWWQRSHDHDEDGPLKFAIYHAAHVVGIRCPEKLKVAIPGLTWE